VFAVAKKPHKPSGTKPPLETTTPEKPDDLILDRKNPRFSGDDVPAGKKGEERIIKRLIDTADLMELAPMPFG
jgi:hypothetical protein